MGLLDNSGKTMYSYLWRRILIRYQLCGECVCVCHLYCLQFAVKKAVKDKAALKKVTSVK